MAHLPLYRLPCFLSYVRHETETKSTAQARLPARDQPETGMILSGFRYTTPVFIPEMRPASSSARSGLRADTDSRRPHPMMSEPG
ncbi:hypothetical protein, partial [Komagataeibacter saccharivorans]|uniref:hypothetical protein n=1 Tax=Komagataeibacter saccharivorans TaxID=265959 RepID=UPI0039EC3455